MQNLLTGQDRKRSNTSFQPSGVSPGDSPVRQWAIVCPGPSLLKKNDHIQHDSGGRVAVNGAIMVGFNNWWVLNDPELFSDVSQLISLGRTAAVGTKLWLFWNFGGMNGKKEKNVRWDKETLEIYKLFQIEYWEKPLLPLSPVIETKVIWSEYSMFCAISLAILKGAEIVRIYGAKLAGEGYFRNGLINWRMDHKERRWARERLYFSHIVEECRHAGIEIIRL